MFENPVGEFNRSTTATEGSLLFQNSTRRESNDFTRLIGPSQGAKEMSAKLSLKLFFVKELSFLLSYSSD